MLARLDTLQGVPTYRAALHKVLIPCTLVISQNLSQALTYILPIFWTVFHFQPERVDGSFLRKLDEAADRKLGLLGTVGKWNGDDLAHS